MPLRRSALVCGLTLGPTSLPCVVAPGTPIVTIADLDHVSLRAYLNEIDLSRVSPLPEFSRLFATEIVDPRL